MTDKPPIIIGTDRLSIEAIQAIACKQQAVELDRTPEFQAKIENGHRFLKEKLANEGVIYGVTTGYGDSCTRPVPLDLVPELPLHLVRFHGCGLGDYFSHAQSRAIMATRVCSLAKGFSGVRYALLEKIIDLLHADIAPVIPEEGSVGASGDLTPLSYLAAMLIGERQVSYRNEYWETADLFEKLQITPLTLAPKEGLAIMNGTAVMTALACEAFSRSHYLMQLSARLTAMAVIALSANGHHFDADLFAVKPHAGQQKIARWIRSDLCRYITQSDRLQNRYSIRCAPHVAGVLADTLPWCRTLIENELNSSNDNPIIDPETEQVLHGGHFYGGHIACVMDTLKTQVANLADLFDRQMALLLDTKYNNGLPANLSGAKHERSAINHGFKAVHIAVSAWTAEALKHTLPASIFSRSTECHNQDKVSMGTIAARDCLRVLTLTEQVMSAHLLALYQAVNLRLDQQTKLTLSEPVQMMLADIASHFEKVEEDRALERDLRRFTAFIREQRWDIYHD